MIRRVVVRFGSGQFGTKKAKGQFGTEIWKRTIWHQQCWSNIVKTDNLTPGQFGTNNIKTDIWHRNFLGPFSSKLSPEICWDRFICQTLLESPVKCNFVLYYFARQVTQTHQNLILFNQDIEEYVLWCWIVSNGMFYFKLLEKEVQ